MKSENASAFEERDDDIIEMGNPIRGMLIAFFATLFFVGCWLLVAVSTGCATDGSLDRAAVTNAIHIVKDIVVVVKDVKDSPAVEATSEPGTTDSAPSAATASAAGPLVFKYGGFHGENAVEDLATQIGGVRFTDSSVSHVWVKGDLGNWGLGRTDAGALACAFYWDGMQWVGGKFEWTSTSRTTRSLGNLLGGYGGWDAAAFKAAKRKAYCIVSKDGRRRTNLAETKEP